MKFEWDVKYIEECIVGFFAILLAVKPIRVWVVTYIKNFLKSRKDKKNIPIILTQIHEKVSDIDIRLKDVEYEIKDPNSGGTLKGALKLIKAEIDATNWLSPRPTFRTTSSGVNVFVNDAYCQLCGCATEELLRLGWKNFMFDNDQADEYYARWLISAKTLSQFASKLKIQDKHGEYRGEWMVRIKPLGPIVNGGENDYVWHGIYHPVDDVAKNYARISGIPLNG